MSFTSNDERHAARPVYICVGSFSTGRCQPHVAPGDALRDCVPVRVSYWKVQVGTHCGSHHLRIAEIDGSRCQKHLFDAGGEPSTKQRPHVPRVPKPVGDECQGERVCNPGFWERNHGENSLRRDRIGAVLHH